MLEPSGLIDGRVFGTFPDNDLPKEFPIPGISSMLPQHATGTSQYYCYRTPLRTNEVGFHDAPWPADMRGGIAIVGDSFVRAEQVPISSTTASLLESALPVPVIAAGNNTLGTFGALRLYQEYVKKLHPSLVVLFFFPVNDVTDNHCAFNSASRCATLATDGTLLMQDVSQTDAKPSAYHTLTEDCFFCKAITHVMRTLPFLTTLRQSELQIREHQSRVEEAWNITEQALALFRDEVESDGSRFVIVIVPGPGESSDPVYAAQTPDEDRTVALISRLNIPVVSLRPSFSSYISQFELKYPYLSFWCDGHWNPVGHYVAAHTMLPSLAKYLPAPLPQSTTTQWLSPKALVGTSTARAIYEHGVYSPPSPD